MDKDSDEDLDNLFRDVYTRHAIDEARHCSLDTLIARLLLDQLPGWLRALNARLLHQMFRGYFDVRWGYEEVLQQLVSDFPELHDRYAEMVRQTRAARGTDYFRELFSRAWSPLTNRNAKRYAMLAHTIERLSAAPP